MKSLCAFSIAFSLLAAPAVFAAEKVVELDASGGTAAGAWVMIFSKAMSPNAPMGTAAVAVGDGDKFEGAFGMSIEAAKPVVSTISQEKIKEERASEKVPEATTVMIKVSAEQHDAVKKIIEAWGAKKDFIDPPNDLAVNFVQEIVDALGMKRAYRTGLAPVNPIQYYGDLAVVNRKLGKDKA